MDLLRWADFPELYKVENQTNMNEDEISDRFYNKIGI